MIIQYSFKNAYEWCCTNEQVLVLAFLWTPWSKNGLICLFVCVRACVRAFVRACVCNEVDLRGKLLPNG